MDQEPGKMLCRDEQKRLVTALRVALRRCQEKGINGTLWRDMLYPANLGLVPENLEQTRNLLKALIGYDPLEGDTRPKGEKQPGLIRSEARQPPSLQDLRQKISVKDFSHSLYPYLLCLRYPYLLCNVIHRILFCLHVGKLREVDYCLVILLV